MSGYQDSASARSFPTTPAQPVRLWDILSGRVVAAGGLPAPHCLVSLPSGGQGDALLRQQAAGASSISHSRPLCVSVATAVPRLLFEDWTYDDFRNVLDSEDEIEELSKTVVQVAKVRPVCCSSL